MFLIGSGDVLLGALDVGLEADVEVYMSASQFEYGKYTPLTIDVVPGRGVQPHLGGSSPRGFR